MRFVILSCLPAHLSTGTAAPPIQLRSSLRWTEAHPLWIGSGLPKRPDELSQHHLIDFLLPQPGSRLEWEFEEKGERSALYPPTVASVGDADARLQLAIAGMGIVQTLCFIAAPALREGKLERLLTTWETPAPELSILYPRDRHLPVRTQVTMDAFTDWIREALRACL